MTKKRPYISASDASGCLLVEFDLPGPKNWDVGDQVTYEHKTYQVLARTFHGRTNKAAWLEYMLRPESKQPARVCGCGNHTIGDTQDMYEAHREWEGKL